MKFKHQLFKGKIVRRTLSKLSGLLQSSSAPTELDRPIEEPEMILEELEARTLFSADPVSSLLNSPEVTEQQTPEQTAIELRLIDNETQNTDAFSIDLGSLDLDPNTEITTLNSSTEIRQELIFIDETVDNYDQLIADVLSNEDSNINFSIFLLNSEKNGIDQITEELQNYQGLDAVHIVSHGSPGTVTLGNTQLNSNNLDDYSTKIAQWQLSFDTDADLLIYGCELASNAAGESLTTQISRLTRTDVAASLDDTGNILLGGDWTLEFSTGSIETEIAFSKEIQHSWDGLLAYQTYRDEFNAASLSNTDGTQDWSSGSWQEIGEIDGESAGNVTVSTVLGEQGLSIKGSGNGSLREVDLSAASNATLSFEYARIGFDDASDSIALEISNNGGSSWTQLDSWQNTANDTSLLFASYNITDYISNNTQIRFLSSGMTDSDDEFFVDNIQIAYNNDISETSESLVNSPGALSQETSSNQAVAVASNGDYVVVWTEVESTGDLSDVFARRYNADGTPKAAEFQVNTTATNDQQWASVATDAEGNFVVVWTSQAQDFDGQGVFLKRFDASGNAIDSNDILVNSGTTIKNQSNPSVAVNSQGEMVIAWQSDKTGGSGIFAKTFDMSTATTGSQLPTTKITVTSGNSPTNPSVDINSEGKFVIAWQNGNEPSVQRFNPDGTMRGSPINFNAFGYTQENAVVAIQESGDFLVAYHNDIPSFEGVWVRHYSDDGSLIGLATQVSSGTSHTAPSIAKDLEGNFIVAYEGPGDGDGQGIFARKYDANRNALGVEFQINQTSSGNQQMVSVAMLNQDNYIVAWSGEGADDANGVYVRQFTTGNSSPTADASAGSPYLINEGDSLVLNGSNSSDLDGNFLSFSWDLNNDGSYGDAVGENPTVSWTTLQGLGIKDNGSYTIGLQVDDGNGGIAVTTTTVTVNNKAPTISTTGSTTVDQWSVYTLNLSAVDPGEDTISSWTINWGDGEIDIITGNPATVTHTYTKSGFTYNILTSATDEDGTFFQNDMLVADYTSNGGFYQFSETGEFIEFIGGTDLNKTIAVIAGPDGNWYGSAESSGNVIRYNPNDDTSRVISSGIGEADALAFGPDGNLYVASYGDNTIYRVSYDAGTDTYTTEEISTNTSLKDSYGIAFGPTGDLFVSNYSDNSVQRLVYDETNDTYTASLFVTSKLGGLKNPEQMAFGPDGELYIASAGTKSVIRFNADSDVLFDVITTLPSNGQISGLTFGPDGKLYLSDLSNGDVYRFNLTPNDTTGRLEVTGAAETFIDAANSGISKATFLSFIPDQQVTITSAANTLPTLTAFSEEITTILEDTTVEITFSELSAKGDQNDAEGPINSFVVKGIRNGLLKIGSSTETATVWSRGSNDIIDINNNAYWTPSADAAGTVNAIGLVAQDSQTGTSTDTIYAQIYVHTKPTLTSFADVVHTITENSEVEISFTHLTDQGDEADATGTVEAFVVKNISSGTLRIGINSGSASVWAAGTNDIIDSTRFAYWTPDLDAVGTLNTFAVVAKDDFGLESTSPVTAQITVSAPPTITSSLTPSVNENTKFVQTLTADDPESDPISYSITGGFDAALFEINASNKLQFISAPNFETPTDNGLNNIYTVEISAGDGHGGIDVQTVLVTITDVNEAPVFDSTAVTAATEDIAYSYSINSSDVDGNSLTITATTIPAWLTLTDHGNGTASLTGTPNNSHVGNHNVVLSVSDGSLVETQSFTVTVSNTNDAPVINSNGGLASAAINLAENQSAVTTVTAIDVDVGDTPTFSITGGADQGLFSISAGGVLSFNTAKDFETKTDSNADGIYEVEVTACDSNSATDVQTILVTITDVNEAPVFDSTAVTAATEDIAYSYTINTSDVDDDSLSITANTLPDWLTLTDNGDDTATLTGTPDNSHVGNHNVVLSISDSSLVATQSFTITVSNTNDAPVINSNGGLASAAITVAENQTAVTTVTATDVDFADTPTFSITGGADQGLFSISTDGVLSFNSAKDFETKTDSNSDGIYQVKVTASDGNSGTDVQTILVTITDVNETPTLVSLSTSTVNENIDTSSGYTVGSLTTTDVDAGDSTIYSINGGADAALFSITGNNLVLTDGVLDFETQSSYQVTVRITDSGTLTHDQTFSINVNDLNEAPVFNSTAVTAATEDIAYSYTINTSDIDGDGLTITATTLPAWLSLTDNSDGTATLTGTPDNNHVGNHSVVLSVSDGSLISNQSFTVTVSNTNNAPVINNNGGLASAAINVAENQTTVTTVTAIDADVGDIPTFSITGGADQGLFSISTGGVLSFNSAKDFETKTDNNVDGIYEVEVTASDGNSGTDVQTILVTITDVNETPTLVSLSTSTVNENIDTTSGYTIGALTTTDVDTGDSTTYSINGGTDAALFSINGNDLVLTDGVLDFETQSSYQVTVRITDSGTLSHDQTFSINVNDLNEAPVFDSTAVTAATEDIAYSYTINTSDIDGDGLTITATTLPAWLSLTDNSDGTATLTGIPDNSHIGNHNVVLSVSDGKLISNQSFTVTVSNTNDAPVINSNGGAVSATINITENQTAVTTISADDPENNPLSYSLTGGADISKFTINANTGQISYKVAADFETPTDADTDNIYQVEVSVSDGYGGTDVQLINVAVNNINEAPSITSNNTQTITENQTDVITIFANDPENDALTFSISGGADQSNFAINTVTGQLSFIVAPDFESPADANTDNIYQVQVQADDGNGGVITQFISVTITDVNHSPIIKNQSFSVSENSLDGSTVGTAIASDADVADSLSFSIIAGNNSNAFSINSSTGEINVTDGSQLNFEHSPNFIITVQVTDNGLGNLSDTATLEINLTDTNEAPDSILLTNNNVDENIDTGSGYNIGSLSSTDEDKADTTTYSISGGGDKLKFTIGGIEHDELILQDGILNFENQSSYEVTIRVVDASGLAHDETFTITINDLNDTPATQIVVSNLPTDAELFDSNLNIETTTKLEVTSKTQPDEQIKTSELQENQEAATVTEQNKDKFLGNQEAPTNTVLQQETKKTENYGNKNDTQFSNSISAKRINQIQIKANLDFLNDQSTAKLTAVTLDENALNYLFEKSGFTKSLDLLREQALENTSIEKMVIGSSVTVTTGLSIGYVVWLIRGGVLLSSVLSSLPAWRMIDPLPIIAFANEASDDDAGDSLESLVKKGGEAVKEKLKLKLMPASTR